MGELLTEVAQNLRERNFEVIVVSSGDEALKAALDLIPDESVVGMGGSTTVREIGLLDALRAGSYDLCDQYEEGISKEENFKRRKRGLTADVFVTGTNAIAKEGALVNIDGMGNRVAALAFGPEKVILVVGQNKICDTIDAALERVQNHVAPKNAARFGVDTPCAKTGECSDCAAAQRICNIYSIIKRQWAPGRIHVILVDEDLGF
jgi:L-lactate utilization protein LutB